MPHFEIIKFCQNHWSLVFSLLEVGIKNLLSELFSVPFSDIPLVVSGMDVSLPHVPTADVPLLSALQQASGAHVAHSSFPDEDDLTSSSTYRSESRETTAEFSDYIETQSR
jgi:hypothetical protein